MELILGSVRLFVNVTPIFIVEFPVTNGAMECSLSIWVVHHTFMDQETASQLEQLATSFTNESLIIVGGSEVYLVVIKRGEDLIAETAAIFFVALSVTLSWPLKNKQTN